MTEFIAYKKCLFLIKEAFLYAIVILIRETNEQNIR